jgi:predicted TIM-barrel fold metal-dependent hydrolase
LHEEVDGIMKKHPKLRLTLAHFGFMSYDINQARRWLDNYENTLFDLTPGGEQLLTMRKDWENWYEFFLQYQDRIIYGTDFYAWPKRPTWEIAFQRRPRFIRQFFETDGEHEYGKNKFVGVKLEKKIRDKIYFENSVREMGLPKRIDDGWLRIEAERVLRIPDKKEEFADIDMQYILKNL